MDSNPGYLLESEKAKKAKVAEFRLETGADQRIH